MEGATETERRREEERLRLDSEGALERAGVPPVASGLGDLGFSAAKLAVSMRFWSWSAATDSSFLSSGSMSLTIARFVACCLSSGRIGKHSDLVAFLSRSRVSCADLRCDDLPCFSNVSSRSKPEMTRDALVTPLLSTPS